jgi:hypothetical protein
VGGDGSVPSDDGLGGVAAASSGGVPVDEVGSAAFSGAASVVFFAAVFLAADFLAVVFLAADFFAGAFFAVVFLAADFFAGAFLAVVFLAVVFLVADVLAGAFFAVVFSTADVPVTCDDAVEGRLAGPVGAAVPVASLGGDERSTRRTVWAAAASRTSTPRRRMRRRTLPEVNHPDRVDP